MWKHTLLGDNANKCYYWGMIEKDVVILIYQETLIINFSPIKTSLNQTLTNLNGLLLNSVS